jgi:myxalamid-type polyketide synthase MxaE and MxaD
LSGPVTFQGDAAYLVTGGLGGLGLEVARWLAQHGAGHLVLIGRHGLPPREQWWQLAADEAPARQVQAVREIEDMGAAVTVLSVDVSESGDMTALFDRFGADLPQLRGIVHAAADLSSGPLTDLTLATLKTMLRPKVTGTWLLHKLSAQLDLDFFVLFSSTTALLGVQGLAHYAAANAFLDAFACYRHSLGLPALSINWGTWSVMRAASAAEQRRAAEFGLEQMPAEQALALMGDFMAEPQRAQVAVASVDWEALKPAYEARRRRPFLAAIEARRTVQTLPAAEAEVVPDLAMQYRAARREDRRDLLLQQLRQTVAKVVGTADPAAIDVHQGLFEMGMDSLMSVELKTRLERQVGRALPSTLTFNYPTIYDLAGYLEEQVLAAEEPSRAVPVEAAPAAAPASAPAANGEIDELTEDELAERLMQRLSQLR